MWRSVQGFPSHYGSRSTYKNEIVWCSPNYVSIPLWFSLNRCSMRVNKREAISFHPTMVLAQQGIVENAFLKGVSIPLWFSLNLPKHIFLASMQSCFHPTMVLAQLFISAPRKTTATSFHPTMVLAQPLLSIVS